jgi:hypothetical protein
MFACSEFPVVFLITPEFHPPTQEATAVKPWWNDELVSSEALAKEDLLRQATPKTK